MCIFFNLKNYNLMHKILYLQYIFSDIWFSYLILIIRNLFVKVSIFDTWYLLVATCYWLFLFMLRLLLIGGKMNSFNPVVWLALVFLQEGERKNEVPETQVLSVVKIILILHEISFLLFLYVVIMIKMLLVNPETYL